jgi:hypothetical protein
MNTLEVIPNPIALLESMRAVGYVLAAVGRNASHQTRPMSLIC